MKDEAGGMPCHGGPVENTDRHLWPQVSDDYYAPSIHVTKEGNIGIDVGGHVFVKTLMEWHALAVKLSKAELDARQNCEIRDYLVKDRDKYANAEYAAIVMIDDRTREIARMTLRLEDRDKTIAEQQREIERLTAIISRYVTHRRGCDARERISNGCTCGLDEVLK